MNGTKRNAVVQKMRVCIGNNGMERMLRNEEGKIYFLDQRFRDEQKHILEDNDDKEILVWVLKDLEKIGFVRLDVTGVLLQDYVDTLKDLTMMYYRDVKHNSRKDEQYLHNDLYNKDTMFEEYQNMTPLDATTQAAQDLDAFYDKMGINTEIAEYRLSLSIAHSYLVEHFGKDK